MLLQRQYSLWKLANTIIAFLIVFSFLASFLIKWRISSIESSIKEENVKLNQLNKKIKEVNDLSALRKIRTADVILKKESNINYYALYKFLNMVKQSLAQKLLENWIKRSKFTLKVDKDKISIWLMVPNYNMLYDENSKFLDSLVDKSFIKRAEIKSYESKWTDYVYFTIDLFTK